MSSSLLNERFRMLFKLSILVILLSTIETGSAIDLVDLPLSTGRKSVNINATLTDANAGTKYFIQESVSASGSTIRGKIVISSEKGSYNIYYNTDSSFNKERLVFHGTNCLPFTFKNNWDQSLPGIKRPVTNLILLMGPSILYRLGHSSLVWTSVADKNIRGTMMKGATTDINGRFRITYYYKKHFDDDYGIKHPSRIEFSGNDPYSRSPIYDEYLILDIYLQNENYYDQLANEVHPLPGIGCPHYLFKNGPSIPKLKSDYVHYTMYEYIKGSTTTRTFSEIHASEKHHLLRLKSNLLGVTTEAIYDYNLGVSYLFEEGGSCSILFADTNSPGINQFGGFYLNSLLIVDDIFFPYRYLGKLNLRDYCWNKNFDSAIVLYDSWTKEHRPGYPVDAWESIRPNVNINGKKVDKAVITQYFAASEDSEIFSGYTLVSTKIAIYKLDSSKKTYTLTDEITRDYINFEKAGLEDELHDEFTLKDCKYLSSDKTLTLAFQFECKGDSCTGLLEKHAYDLKKDLVNYVILRSSISPLRIDNVQYNFNDEQLEIEVTFLDSPNLQYIFNSKTMSVSADTFSKMIYEGKTSDAYGCLNKLAKVFDNINVAIYRPSDSSCGYLKDFEDLKEDAKAGVSCSIFHFPLFNLRSIDLELSLDQIHDNFKENLGWGVSYHVGNSYQSIKIVDIIDKTENKITSVDDFQSQVRVDSKLNSNGQVTVIVPDAKTLADCYRTCHNSEQLKCNTFSFCQNGECRVSSLLTIDLYNDSQVEQDKSCSIHAVNALNDYLECRFLCRILSCFT
uniref:Apple domain-containing protein n=1 Tax=Tetranychus urticae TaxID=32264 RepID=T1KP36_TETUR